MNKTLDLDFTNHLFKGSIELPLSKSLCNRALVLASNFPHIKLAKTGDSDDTRLLTAALEKSTGVVDVGAAGTAMRFSCAYFASRQGADVKLQGSERMHERPIHDLVDSLRKLGADIEYMDKEGYPPLRIVGKKLQGGALNVKANTSSQFVTALLLVAPTFSHGLELNLMGEVVSGPYIQMTVDLMAQLGFQVIQREQIIVVKPEIPESEQGYLPEADWSAAAYWYAFVALSENGAIQLNGLQQESLQGDNRIARIFEELGVKSTFNEQGVRLEKRSAQLPARIVINLIENPDLAQPIAFACAAMGIGAELRGLQTLRIKETDRMQAIKTELAKVGVDVQLTENTLSFDATSLDLPSEDFETHQDHRMAMSVALLATRVPITLEAPEVVSKSYPGFWEDIQSVSNTANP